jgi:hypothetical protein
MKSAISAPGASFSIPTAKWLIAPKLLVAKSAPPLITAPTAVAWSTIPKPLLEPVKLWLLRFSLAPGKLILMHVLEAERSAVTL